MGDYRDGSAISADRLITDAIGQAGTDDFGSDSFRPGLDLLCDGLRGNEVRPGGRAMLANEAMRMLINRLRIVDWRSRSAGRPVEAPIVILGLPRTGTTALSYLLDQDPQFRSLLNWEATQSAPPPTDATLRCDERCTELLEFQRAIIDSIDPPPPHWEWADGPTECTFVLAQDFKTVMWESRLPNPAYRDFITTCDMGSAYAYHRSVLEVLGATTSGRWVLKMPAHAYFVDALLAEYPDAQIVWTHRDPLAATASFLDLISFSHGLTLGQANTEWIVGTYPDRLVEQVERPMRALADSDVYHFHYARYIGDPLGEIAALYNWLGVELTAPVRSAMQNWLDADPLEVSRRQRSSLADYDIDSAALEQRFAEYTDTYDVDTTGRRSPR